MKKRFLTLFILTATASTMQAQTITDTVSTGAAYANQVWYNLENGHATTVGGSSWDFGFQINGFSAAIIANTAYGATLYKYPNGDTASWLSLDTAGMGSWTAWYDLSTTWEQGAFNRGIDTTNALDLGWGQYNFITHHVIGDSLFVWKTASGSIYKLWIQRLASGAYHFLVADYNGNTTDTVIISKSNFSGKNFGYYSIANSSVIDIEPLSNNWDLIFSKYIEDLGVPYSVSGIRTNSGIETVQVYPVNNSATYDSARIHIYTQAINVIGHDWKSFNFGTFSYDIEDSTVYFVKTDSTTYWKVVMKGFGGSSNGNYIFEKTKLNQLTRIHSHSVKQSGTFLMYPNPTSSRTISLVADIPVSVKQCQVNILNLKGQLIRREEITIRNAFEAHTLSLEGMEKGFYLIQLNHEKGSVTKQLILK